MRIVQVFPQHLISAKGNTKSSSASTKNALKRFCTNTDSACIFASVAPASGFFAAI